MDPLTGLLNRRGLEERMDVEVRRALRHESPMAVAIVDIDHFKHVNDEHGHEVGDRVLAWVGAVLAGSRAAWTWPPAPGATSSRC